MGQNFFLPGNIFMFDKKFDATFLKILYFLEGKFLKKYYYHSWESNIFIGKKYCSLWKDQNTSIINQNHLPPPSSTTIAGQPPSAVFIKGIFENLSNIPENSICILNMPKILYLKKLLSKIISLKILFPEIKIQSVYQTRWICSSLCGQQIPAYFLKVSTNGPLEL